MLYAAEQLAEAFGAARADLRKAKPGIVGRPSHLALVAAFVDARAAYRTLASSARTGRRLAYRRAVVLVRRAEADVARAARSFQP